MARVYRATHARTGRVVALKVLDLSADFRGASVQDARMAFVREAQLAQGLQHPDIVAILDAGQSDGRAYLVMEYVPGADLGGHTRTGSLLPPWQVLAIMARVARALAYAHAAGVVHSDIKPANILYDAASDSVKVMDFGIAHPQGDATRAGAPLLGSPSYMAPERMQGAAPDALSDVYSMGVTLYQLLTGSLPFRGDSLAQLMDHICHQPAAGLRTLSPGLPEAIESLVASAMARQPQDRMASALTLAQSLEQLSAQQAHFQPEPARDSGAHGRAGHRPAKMYEATMPLGRPPSLSAAPGRFEPGN
jgi:eukaryotic-like serine/threonine-protein kinase